MTKDLIRYDLLVQDALKGVVRKVLGDAARDGLPGEHHFYISFRTDFPGVRLSQRMREKYPDVMTIVLQHQFWDLAITEHSFEVGLSFSGVPERLLVPFDAVTAFFDPSVQFGLKFELQEAEAAPAAPPAPAAVPKPAARGAGSEPAEIAPKAASTPKIPSVKPAVAAKPVPAKAPAAKGKPAEEPPSEQKNDAAPAGNRAAEVVSLDAFRKKS